MIWLLISVAFFLVSFVLPFADVYAENMIIQIFIVLARSLGLVTFGIWLGVLCA